MKAEYLPAADDTIGLLTHLAEECNEVAKQCMKAVRFGLDNAYPKGAETNAQKIMRELQDVALAGQRVRDLVEHRSGFPLFRVVAATSSNSSPPDEFKLHEFAPYSTIIGHRFVSATIHARLDCDETFVHWLKTELLPRIKTSTLAITWVDPTTGYGTNWPGAMQYRDALQLERDIARAP